MFRKLIWIIFGFFSVVVGIYPVLYGLVDMSQGYLSSKTQELLSSSTWYWFFYQHIIFGAFSLLVGWIQFSNKQRRKYPLRHRNLGKTYILSVLLSGMAGLYLSVFATGGYIASLGFGAMAILWLFTTVMAYLRAISSQFVDHQHWMIRSYALCWAAVTLRLWLPVLQAGMGLDFLSAYRAVSWLCWIPNLIFAEVMIARLRTSVVTR